MSTTTRRRRRVTTGDARRRGRRGRSSPRSTCSRCRPAPIRSIDWGLTSHLDADGTPKIVERHLLRAARARGAAPRSLREDADHRGCRARRSRQIIDDPAAPHRRPRAEAGDDRRRRRALRHPPRRARRSRPARARSPCSSRGSRGCYVIDKPARPAGARVGEVLLQHAHARDVRSAIPDEPELQICHRLDRETSRLPRRRARSRGRGASIKGAFATKDAVTKEYLAVVHGQPPWDAETTLDIPLRLAQPGDPTRLPHVRMLPGPGGLHGDHAGPRRAARRPTTRWCAARSSPAASTRSARTSRRPGFRSSATSSTRTATTRSSSTATRASSPELARAVRAAAPRAARRAGHGSRTPTARRSRPRRAASRRSGRAPVIRALA